MRSVYAPRSQKRKNLQSSHQCLFALLGPKCVKVACKMFVKLTPGCCILSIWRGWFIIARWIGHDSTEQISTFVHYKNGDNFFTLVAFLGLSDRINRGIGRENIWGQGEPLRYYEFVIQETKALRQKEISVNCYQHDYTIITK